MPVSVEEKSKLSVKLTGDSKKWTNNRAIEIKINDGCTDLNHLPSIAHLVTFLRSVLASAPESVRVAVIISVQQLQKNMAFPQNVKNRIGMF